MIIVNGKIDAIKRVRQAGMEVRIVQDETTGRNYLTPGIGLRDAKDLTEAIMALGVLEYLRNAVATEEKKSTYPPTW